MSKLLPLNIHRHAYRRHHQAGNLAVSQRCDAANIEPSAVYPRCRPEVVSNDSTKNTNANEKD